MEVIPSMKLDRRSIGVDRSDDATALHDERLIALSSWMVILGTIRVICTFADLVSAFVNATRFESLSMKMLSNFVEANQPFLALGVVWPLFLGIVVRRTRWPDLLSAAGVCFLILSIGGLTESIAEWNHASGQGITFGSFHLTRLTLVKPALSDVILAALGAGQLVVEFATGVRCLVLYRRLRGSTARAHDSSKQEVARRARIGRLAIYASIGFLMLMIRLPVWSTYVEIINDSRIVREFVLKNDGGRTKRPRRAEKAVERGRADARTSADAGAAFSATNNWRISWRRKKPTLMSSLERNRSVSCETAAWRARRRRRPSPEQRCLAAGDLSQNRDARPGASRQARSGRGCDRTHGGKLLEHARCRPLSGRGVGRGEQRSQPINGTPR